MSETTERLDAIEARLEAATPGPWEHDEDGFMGCGQVYTADSDLYGGNIAAPSGDLYQRSGYSPKDDMVFIANTPSDVAYLLTLARKQAAALWRVERLAARWATLADGDRYYARHIRAALDDAQ